ncbi:hypothetical protein VFPPC_13085 [Pochonia chlamydosporia 170]|uniref:Uncharacterized protein n=1 Tax=Pochonia chlamydosporia 170 TaxID=1380566 RepID=A0A179G8J4_METCM|nr:hypothetical protein VFPPC_13085 [Pochonia chlamydosporia 170]OAQ73810.1 hypothetical protein VFPPC_13085 [Pochonia chlamydosporia 170]
MATTSHAFPLATETAGNGGSGYGGGDDIGNGGDSSRNSMSISTGGLVAIVVIVVIVAIIGACTATLFFIAKKREWKASEVLRHSVKKVVTAITPRRTEFPDSVKRSMGSSKHGRKNKGDDVPPTPRLRPEDLEKGLAQTKEKSKSRG